MSINTLLWRSRAAFLLRMPRRIPITDPRRSMLQTQVSRTRLARRMFRRCVTSVHDEEQAVRVSRLTVSGPWRGHEGAAREDSAQVPFAVRQGEALRKCGRRGGGLERGAVKRSRNDATWTRLERLCAMYLREGVQVVVREREGIRCKHEQLTVCVGGEVQRK